MVSPGSPLTGERGQLVHRSPDGRLEVRRAIMSTFPAEAIVNATDLLMTINTANMSGAAHQITHAAGSKLRTHLHYNYPLGLRVGDALASPSFELTNCYYIIHVNGPNYITGTKRLMPFLRQQLADCYRRCMEEAFRLGVKSIAFPCISTGIMRWPRGEAAKIGVATVRAWLRHPIHGQERGVIERVAFLADPVEKQAHQKQAWCAAFREFWPQMLLPRRPSRNSFLNYVDKQEIVRLKRDADQPVETKEGVSVALAPKLRSPVVTRQPSAGRNDVRRSQRFRKRPDRYGYSN